MREIKSRAWVTGLTKEPSMIYQYNPWEFSIDFKGTLTIHDYMIGQSFEKDDYELMQFTGLHDKNGKEIYEGDRISGDTTYTLEVYIDKGHTKMKFFDEHRQLLKQDLYQEEIDDESMIIIGNIYENPELLKGEGE